MGDLRDLLDLDAIAVRALDRVLSPTWTHAQYFAAPVLKELGTACEPHLTRAIERATGTARRHLEEIRSEVAGGPTIFRLEVAGADGGLSATLLAPDGTHLGAATLPAVPKCEDLQPLLGVHVQGASVRIVADDIDSAIMWRLSDFVVDLGAGRAIVG